MRIIVENATKETKLERKKRTIIENIREFKKLIKNYFARTAQEKLKRKADKIKMKFKIFGKLSDAASKAVKFQAALKSLASILST